MDPIPHIIHQTHKSREFIKSNKKLSEAAQSWIDTGYDYRFYDDTQADDFMKTLEDEFPGIYNDYNRLPIPVMKADFFRYCVVYKHGGIYADADTVLVDGKIDKLVGYNGFVCVAENKAHMCQWIFSAPKGCSLLKKVIDVIMNKLLNLNIRDRIRETRHYIHDLTGPAIFTQAFREYLLENGETEDAVNAWNADFRATGILSRNKILIHPCSFHKDTVTHLFSGQWKNGWCEQRDELYNDLKYNGESSIKVVKIISDSRWPDTFKTSVSGNKLTIQRTDSTGGWGQHELKVSVLIYNKDGKTEEKTIHIGCSTTNVKEIIVDNNPVIDPAYPRHPII